MATPKHEKKGTGEMRKILAFGIFVIAGSASALGLPEWKRVPGLTTANIAATKGAQLEASTGHSWPDGQQALVTFWLLGDLHLRCETYFDKYMAQTGEICEQPQEPVN